MSIVKLKDKRSGTTYVYESESYWDKEIIPTGKSGRKKGTTVQNDEVHSPEPITEYIKVIEERDALIRDLKAENKALKKERQEILQTLNELCRKLAD